MKAVVSRLTPRQILLAGWGAFLLYAWPGFMSFDSIYQLQESREGFYSDGHPPMMAQLWRIVELVIAGPAGMLLLQSSVFLAGVFLIFRQRMKDRTAAIAAVLFLWFPPVGSVIAVIWKDSQMTAWIVLGAGLLLSERRGHRLWGLAAIALGTAMRHNALVMTLPLVVLLFVWNKPDQHRARSSAEGAAKVSDKYGFVKRYAIAIVAWIVVTMSARVVSNALTDEHRHIYAHSLQLCDITTTLRFVDEPIPDAVLLEKLRGSTMAHTTDLHARTKKFDPAGSFVDNIWWNAYSFFRIPETDAERAGNAKAWKAIVFGYPEAYLAYRWAIFSRVLGIDDSVKQSPFYTWFVDIQSPMYTHIRIHHDASPSGLQEVLREVVHAVGRAPISRVILYMVLAVLLLPFCWRDREVFAWLVSAFANEAFLFVFSPTTDWRYSYWLILAVSLGVVLLVARRAKGRTTMRKTLPQPSPP
ncbi:MAG: hypothetical protein ACKV2T_20290 [Kofleriaceae bacterium]